MDENLGHEQRQIRLEKLKKMEAKGIVTEKGGTHL